MAEMRKQFWTPRRQRVYPRIVLVLTIVWPLLFFAYSWNSEANAGRTYGGDFIAYSAAGKLAAEGHPSRAYEDQAIYEAELRIGTPRGLVPFHYPPPFLALSRGLAMLGFPVSLVVWLGVTGLLFAAVVASTPRRFSARSALLVMPAAIVNFGFGQNGFLTAAILGFALTSITTRPVFAGLLLGLLVYKPQFLPLILLVLVATGMWRTLFAAALSGALLAGLSALVLGASVWRTYVMDVPDAYEVLTQTGSWDKMTTLYSSLRLAAVPGPLIQTLSFGLIAATSVAVVRIWRSEATHAAKAAALMIGVLLATPYAFSYDLTIASIGAIWLVQETAANGRSHLDRLAIALLALNPLIVTHLAKVGPLQFGWVPLVLALSILLVRTTRSRATTFRTEPNPETALAAS